MNEAGVVGVSMVVEKVAAKCALAAGASLMLAIVMKGVTRVVLTIECPVIVSVLLYRVYQKKVDNFETSRKLHFIKISHIFVLV